MNRIILKTSFLYMVEYTILFIYQLLCYLIPGLKNGLVEKISWVVILVLSIVNIILIIGISILLSYRYIKISLGLKVLEFLLDFFIFGWLAAYDFAFVSFSYILLFNMIVLIAFIQILNRVSMFPLIGVLFAIIINAIGLTLGISYYYITLP